MLDNIHTMSLDDLLDLRNEVTFHLMHGLMNLDYGWFNSNIQQISTLRISLDRLITIGREITIRNAPSNYELKETSCPSN